MAKKALVNKANKKPKFAVRAYTRCQRCGRPALGVPQVRPVPNLRSRDGARGRAAGRSQELLVTKHFWLASVSQSKGKPLRCRPTAGRRSTSANPVLHGNRCEKGDRSTHDHDRSNRRLLDASAQRQLGVPRRGEASPLEDQGEHRRDPQARGLHLRFPHRGRRGGQDPHRRPEVRPQP